MIHRTVVLYEDVIIEENVHIGPYCVIGGPPEHREFFDGRERSCGVIIRSGARIFSHATIDAGTIRATEIGENSAIFNHSHVAHDCIIGSNVTVGGKTTLAGHTHIMDGANVSGNSCTFQRVVIGAYSFIGGMSFVTRDVPPGEKWLGLPVKYVGQNDVGLSRSGMTYAECMDKYQKHFERLLSEKG